MEGEIIAPIGKVMYVDGKIVVGKEGVNLLLNRNLHKYIKKFVGQELTVHGTIKLEFNNNILLRCIFFVTNSFLFSPNEEKEAGEDNRKIIFFDR